MPDVRTDLGFPGGSGGKEYACNARDLDSPWVGKIPLEKGMATHSSILAWKNPWTEEPIVVSCSRLQSIGEQRIGRD